MNGETLNLLPDRVPIGAVRGTSVYITPEFSRVLAALLGRVGGQNGMSTDDLGAELATAQPAALVGQLAQMVFDLQLQVAALSGQLAAVLGRPDVDPFGQIPARPADVDPLTVTPPTDWERPGKIGAAARNTGAFSGLAVDAGTVGKPALYFGADTTTGLYRIGANNWGVAVAGAKLADFGAGRLAITGQVMTTTGATLGDGSADVNVIVNGTAAGAAGGASVIVRNGGNTVLAFGNKSVLVGGGYSTTPYIYHVGVLTTSGSLAVGAALTVGGAFGCNGQAAQGANALGGAATDALSTQNLANNIRAALIACGIGS